MIRSDTRPTYLHSLFSTRFPVLESIGNTRSARPSQMKEAVWMTYYLATVLVLALTWAQSSEATSSCDICSGRTLRSEREIPLLQITCDSAASNTSRPTPQKCISTLTPEFNISSFCCEDIQQTQPSCSLCSGDNQIIPSQTLTTQHYGLVTCGDFEEAASMVISDDTCLLLQVEASSVCCTELSDSVSRPCELLCPDGSTPPDLSKKDPITGYTCADMMSEYLKFQKDDEKCQESVATNLGFDGVAFCCPNVDPPRECTTCSADFELLYPERILFLYQDQSCRVLDESLAYVVGTQRCEQILTESRADSNCRCRPKRQSSSPTLPDSSSGGNQDLSGIIESRSLVCSLFLALFLGLQLSSCWGFDYI